MKIKLIALALSIASLTFTSCEGEDYSDGLSTNNNIVLSGANEVPAVTTAATGKAVATYNTRSKTLHYTITWSGLTANASMAHIHGPASPGFNAPILQTFTNFPAATSGTYTNTLFADGVQIKEEDILAGRLYINIHTSTFPAGEIRGQITFN